MFVKKINLKGDLYDIAAVYDGEGNVINETYALKTDISAVYRVKGSSTFEDLPTDAEVGDVYNITDDFELDGVNYTAGTNVVWTEDGWDALSGTIDLSSVENAINNEISRAESAEADLQSQIDTLTQTELQVSYADETLIFEGL